MEETPVTIETMAKREPETTPANAVVDQKVVAELRSGPVGCGTSLTVVTDFGSAVPGSHTPPRHASGGASAS